MTPPSDKPKQPVVATPHGGETMLTRGPHSAQDGGTLPSSAATTTAATVPVCVPGYEILGELGRGGMGVVYRARQIKANRLVALKMILAGGHAGDADLARFRTEAEALARLQHPNIVQVHDVGEREGKPYFSLEFCSGGSLDRKLGGTPLPPFEAAKLVETLALAMHAAHQAHVIHRDLKPANVLLLEDGTPKITDFGLAKKLDDASGQTQSGVVMGTPSYMAPEQASGKSKELGPAADIYALGALLYECLTGRAPFRAATSLETMLQVIGDDPVPPSQLQSKTPRDLETIALKCLRKDPAKRYATATELAAELARFQRGEPILARPVGMLERGVRWCRRNPLAASLLGVVLLVFATGATVSTVLALVAREEADNARQSESKEILARKDLEKANEDLLTSVAQSLMGPMALYSQPNQPLTVLNEPEIASLWKLASSKDDRLRLYFIREALREPATTRQLKDRAEVALHAVVGLDEERRKQVEQLLGDRLQAAKITREEQVDVAMILSQLGVHDPLLTGKVADVLTQAMSRTTESAALYPLLRTLTALTPRMEPAEAARAAERINQGLRETTNLYQLEYWSESLRVIAIRLGPKEAAQSARTLTQAMSKATNPTVQRSFWRSLSALALRTDREDTTQIAATLSEAMSKTTIPHDLQLLSQGLLALAERMEPKESARIHDQLATQITEAIGKTTDINGPGILSRTLIELASRIEPKQDVRFAGVLLDTLSKGRARAAISTLTDGLMTLAERMEPKEAAATLIQAMQFATDQYYLVPLSRAFSESVSRMRPKEVGETAEGLIQIISKGWDPTTLRFLSEGLSALAVRMEPKEAGPFCDRAAVTVAKVMSKATYKRDLLTLSPALTALIPFMGPKGFAEAAALVSSSLNSSWNDDALPLVFENLSKLSARMEPGNAVVLLTEAMAVMKSPYHSRPMVQAMSEAANRMTSKEAARAALGLSQSMSKTTAPLALRYLSEGLSVLAVHMEPKEAEAICGQAVAGLIQVMSKTTTPLSLQYLSEGISTLAMRMEPKEAATVCGKAAADIALTLGKSTDILVMAPFCHALSALAGRMEPKEASLMCSRAAATVIPVLLRTTYTYPLQSLSEGLAALATRMEPKDIALHCGQAVAKLSQSMNNTKDPDALRAFAKGLAALAVQMEPKAAHQVADVLTLTLSKTTNLNAMYFIAQDLATVAGRMEPLAAATVLTRPQGMPTSQEGARHLTNGLSNIAPRLTPKEAAQVALTIAQDMSKKTDTYDLRFLSECLSVVVVHMEPNDAAAILVQVMSKTTNPLQLSYLSRGLSEAAARMKPKEAAVVCGQAVLNAAQAMTYVNNLQNPRDMQTLAERLAVLANYLDPRDASRAATTLAPTLSKVTDFWALQSISQVLTAVAGRMEAKDADQTTALTEAIRKTTNPGALRVLSGNLSSWSAQRETKEVVPSTAILLHAISKTANATQLQALSEGFLATLTREDSVSARRRSLSVASTVTGLAGPSASYGALACSQPALAPPPSPVPPQILVDILKHPLCVGAPRRQVLDQLARHYNRPFADPWEFVEYVRQNQLDLDLTTPPQKPTLSSEQNGA